MLVHGDSSCRVLEGVTKEVDKADREVDFFSSKADFGRTYRSRSPGVVLFHVLIVGMLADGCWGSRQLLMVSAMKSAHDGGLWATKCS